jgi:transcriptional regulator with XRE-family HTH domain
MFQKGYRKLRKMGRFGVRFGRLIRDKRGIEGMSQDALAGASGLTKARISEIETGKTKNPQARTVDALCVALNISREERNACQPTAGPRLPPLLLENLALRFGHTNPDALEDDLEAFLKEKAVEFREMQERLARMNTAEGRITDLIAAANAALEDGDFRIADERLADAEDAQLESTTRPALERQCRLRFERGHAAILGGEISTAAKHWERAAKFFHFLDRETEAEKRHEYCTTLREYGYRYRSAEALVTAGIALEDNLSIWSKDKSLQNWCKTMIALGGVNWRLSQFDAPENFATHIARAKSSYEAVRDSCSENILPYYYAASGGNIANVYSDRNFARTQEEYCENMKISLQIQISVLTMITKIDRPVDWGILQHNLGLCYIKFFELQHDKPRSMDIIDKAIHHLELSFEVRDPDDSLQYWIASCRSLGEALIERSIHQWGANARNDLQKSYKILTDAASKISEIEHPNQWTEIQEQIARCRELQSRKHRPH